VHCKQVSDLLLIDHGIYVQPITIRPCPRAPRGCRFTPTPFHDDPMMDRLVRVMDSLWTRCNVKRHSLAA